MFMWIGLGVVIALLVVVILRSNKNKRFDNHYDEHSEMEKSRIRNSQTGGGFF